MPIARKRRIATGLSVIFIIIAATPTPRELNEKHIESFLSHLVTDVKVSAATQPGPERPGFPLRQGAGYSAERKYRSGPVQKKPATARLLGHLTGTHALMAELMYGGGLRLMECVRLRIKDVDFWQGKLFVRGGKAVKTGPHWWQTASGMYWSGISNGSRICTARPGRWLRSGLSARSPGPEVS